MSTTFEIGRWPAAISRCLSHSGDGPDLHVLEHARGEAQADLGVAISTRGVVLGACRRRSARRPRRSGSSAQRRPGDGVQLARHAVDAHQSGRLGVISISSTSSAIGSCSASGVAGRQVVGQHHDPGVVRRRSRPRPRPGSSRSTRRRAAWPRPASVPSGIIAPGSATATVWPAATLGAPQTIVRGSPEPSSTAHTRQPVGVGVLLGLEHPARPRTPPGRPRRRGRAARA